MIEDLPDTQFERAPMMQNVLIDRATGGQPNPLLYAQLRSEFIGDPQTKPLLPDFVRTCRDLPQFWGLIKSESDNYQGRREYIYGAFTPLLDHLELANRAPADPIIADTLLALNANEVSAVWAKALARRMHDPEGAITSARQLLESVCKHILEDLAVDYSSDADLPKLWSLVAAQLNLAPSQHTEKVFKSILGGCHTIVQNIGSVRNRIGDAHGQGRSPVKAAPRHAALVVNLAGAMATFLVETYQARTDREGN